MEQKSPVSKEKLTVQTYDRICAYCLRRIVLVPLQNVFCFEIDTSGAREAYPETMTAEICGEETEFACYLDGDEGGGSFFYGGILYDVRFRSLEDAERFLAGLKEMKAKQGP